MQSFFHAVCLFSAVLGNRKAGMAASCAVMPAFFIQPFSNPWQNL